MNFGWRKGAGEALTDDVLHKTVQGARVLTYMGERSNASIEVRLMCKEPCGQCHNRLYLRAGEISLQYVK